MIPTRTIAFALAATMLAQPAHAAGDLLVAPTRVVLEGGRGTEVILNNVGNTPATYRISLELRRMTPEGRLEEVVTGTESAKEKAVLAMVSYAPRRVTLPPNQPQVIRVGARIAPELPDGEYRAHMLFRAVPDAQPVVNGPREGVSIALTPIYGVTIPVIVRKGALKATAAISNIRLARSAGETALAFDLSRSGDRSVYGRVRVTKAGVAKPVYEARGIAVYAELSARTVALPLPPELAATLTGPVTVQYLEDNDTGGLIAEAQGVLR
ncbi:molecular chaperone [Sphingomonas sp. SUN039]|uniref:fimbrial biogenesis chaperone n=1 Tax=Sphingomonas sp. SUN039 TaxID=2937787 RepID=UPI0021645168|nr:molecular chaperone [Sphingomonas sp. SUN039]UVO55173.1 molecular chaperone [Sphingomonas sp. SUN039]